MPQTISRLDTHLRVSAICHQFSPLAPPSSDIQPQHPQTKEPDQAAILNFPPAQAAILDSTPSQRPRVKLPVRQEEWEVANIHFSQVLVPEVLAEVSLESIKIRLSDGIYHYFASEYGVKQHSKQRRRKDKLAKALNEAKKEKNEARRMLHQARATGNKSAEEIMSLARSFYKMVRSHNRCKGCTREQSGQGMQTMLGVSAINTSGQGMQTMLGVSAINTSGHSPGDFWTSHLNQSQNHSSLCRRLCSTLLTLTMLFQSRSLILSGCLFLLHLLLSSIVRRLH